MGRHKGWIVKPHRSGKFIGRVRWQGRYRSKTHHTQQLAESWCKAEAAKQHLGMVSASEGIAAPTAAWIADYLTEQRRRRRVPEHLAQVKRILIAAAKAVPDLADGRAVQRTRAWLADLAGDDPENPKMAPPTLNRHLAVLRAYVRWLVTEQHLAQDPLARVRRVKQPKVVKPVFSVAELRSLVAQTDHPYHAHLILSAYLGLRTSETCSWERMGPGVLVVRLGKGAKDRIAPVQAEAAPWVPEKAPAPIRSWHHRSGLLSLCKAAGVTLNGRSPHSLRHTWCALLCASGENLALVKSLAGHESITTTAGYAEMATAFPEARAWARGEIRIVTGWAEPWEPPAPHQPALPRTEKPDPKARLHG